MHRCRFTESSSTQLPNEYDIYIYICAVCRCIAEDRYIYIYNYIYICAGGDDCLKTPRSGYTQMTRGRSKDTSGDQFLKRNYNLDFF